MAVEQLQRDEAAFVQLSKEDETAIEKALRASFPEDHEALVKEVLGTLAAPPADQGLQQVCAVRIQEGLVHGPADVEWPAGKKHTFTGLGAKGTAVGSGHLRPMRCLKQLVNDTASYSFHPIFYPPVIPPHNNNDSEMFLQRGVLFFYSHKNEHKKEWVTGWWAGWFPGPRSDLQQFRGPGQFN